MRKRKTCSYNDDLLADLNDSDYAATYLLIALSDSKEVLLLALREVAEALKRRRDVGKWENPRYTL
jgi:hypothetical protein